MTWSVLVPLAAALLGGFVGAWANSYYRDREAKKAGDRERISLLFLLDAEIIRNTMYLAAVDVGPPAGPVNNLRMDVWEKTQVRLAHLLAPKEMKSIVSYYLRIELEQTPNLADLTDQADMSDDDWESIQQLIKQGGALSRMIQNHIQDTEYNDVLELIERKRERK